MISLLSFAIKQIAIFVVVVSLNELNPGTVSKKHKKDVLKTKIKTRKRKQKFTNFTRFAVSEQLSRNHTKPSKPEIMAYKYMLEREESKIEERERVYYTSR